MKLLAASKILLPLLVQTVLNAPPAAAKVDLSGMSSCAANCYQVSYDNVQCSSVSCACSDSVMEETNNTIAICLDQMCTDEQADRANNAFDELCAEVGDEEDPAASSTADKTEEPTSSASSGHSSGTPAAATDASSSTPTTTPAASDSADSAPSGSTMRSATIGLGVGLGVAVLLIFVLGFLWMRMRKAKREKGGWKRVSQQSTAVGSERGSKLRVGHGGGGEGGGCDKMVVCEETPELAGSEIPPAPALEQVGGRGGQGLQERSLAGAEGLQVPGSFKLPGGANRQGGDVRSAELPG
ncbi:hypothetical protein MKZ38_000010 [Zalerion maritima]|uniref:CFEM domain-containing protein n=1 Tax=Zalerion maritima TaxID=339359 RepID=A0AAD5RFH3_9PEZI|nr:hypothetical protein MKZ38_000010 [Zalerion maritima]